MDYPRTDYTTDFSSSMIDPVKNTIENLHEVTKALHRKKSYVSQTPFSVIDKDEFTGKNRKKHLQGDAYINIDTVLEEPLPSRKWSICRATTFIQDFDERMAFIPRMVSIGPFHYKISYTRTMEAHKLRFLDRLLKSCNHPQVMLEKLEDAMRELELETRECYSEEFPEIDSDNFTRMMLVDGCFLIELLRLYHRRCKGQLSDDPLFETRWLPFSLSCDILLLENQLPLFVLQKLYELTNLDDDDDDDEQVSLNKLALQFFESLRPGKDIITIEDFVDKGEEKSHLLALFHSSFFTNTPKPPARIRRRSNKYNTFSGKCWFYNAKLLVKHGIHLKKKPGNILDIELNKKELRIPTLFIDENTTIVLKNLVAYEQNDRRASSYFMSLVFFISNLLLNTEDAGLLMAKGIIRQTRHQGEEVVELFDNLAANIAFDIDNCYLSEIVRDINMFTHTRSAQFKVFLSSVSLRISIIEFMFFLTSTTLSIVSLITSLKNN